MASYYHHHLGAYNNRKKIKKKREKVFETLFRDRGLTSHLSSTV